MKHLIKAKLLIAENIVKNYLVKESLVAEYLVTVKQNSQSKTAGTKWPNKIAAIAAAVE